MVFCKAFPYSWIFFITMFKVGHGVKDTLTLINEIKSRSDSRVPPNDLSGVPVIVNVSMYITNLGAIDETKMELRFDAYIRKMWNDPRLAYSDGPEHIHFGYDTAKSFIWMPDLYFTKTTTTQITESFKRDAFVRIKSNGDIRVSLRTAMTQRCQMDLHSFPFDKQTCKFKISTYFSSIKDVKLNWYSERSNSTKPKGVYVTKKKFPPGFVLTDYTSDSDTLKYADSYHVLNVMFYLNRIRTHYIVLTYIPSLLLVLLSCLLFWLPLTAVLERFLFGSLLVLGLNQVLAHSQDQAPQVGYLKAIDVWVVSCYTFVCVALAEVILLYLLAKRMTGVKGDEIELVKNDELSESTKQVTTGQSRGFIHSFPLEKLDLVLKFLYPSAFLLFNIVYWATFA